MGHELSNGAWEVLREVAAWINLEGGRKSIVRVKRIRKGKGVWAIV